MTKVFSFWKLGRSKAAGAEMGSEETERRVDSMSAPDRRGAVGCRDSGRAATLDSGPEGRIPKFKRRIGDDRMLGVKLARKCTISHLGWCTGTAEAWPTITFNVVFIVPGNCKYEEMCINAALPEKRDAVTDRIRSDPIRFMIHNLASRKCHLEPQMRIWIRFQRDNRTAVWRSLLRAFRLNRMSGCALHIRGSPAQNNSM
jgi:hypothetical protein